MMANAQIIEGTTEEIATLLQGGAFAGRKLRVIIDPEEEDFSPELLAPPNTIRDEEHLVELLREGLNSGPAVTMTQSDWDDIRREVRERAAIREKKQSADA